MKRILLTMVAVLMFVGQASATTYYGDNYRRTNDYNQGGYGYGQEARYNRSYEDRYNQSYDNRSYDSDRKQTKNYLDNVKPNFEGKGIDYEGGYVYAVGTGRMDYGGIPGMEDLAREAAIVDAQRNLVGAVNGAQIDSDTTVEMKKLVNDTIHRKISGIVKNAIIIDEGTAKNGSYYVKMVAPLYGVNSVAAIAFDEPYHRPEPVPQPQYNILPREEYQHYETQNYTGLIIDCQGCDLDPCMSPVIYRANGEAIYGYKNIDSQFAINKGMVGYAHGHAESMYNENIKARVGAFPLVIRAIDATGGRNSVNRVNPVVSDEDADRILAANHRSHFLDNCAVVFVR